ncbi:MAG: LysM peptidoglycan-binding domain-containing protein [Nocardioides sp.]
MTRYDRLARCLAVWLFATSALLILGRVALANLLAAARTPLGVSLPEQVARQPFDTLLVWLCSAVALGCCLWLWLMTSLVVVNAALGGARVATRGCPDSLHRLVLVACGVATVGSLALPAHAAPLTGTAWHPNTSRTNSAQPDGPDRTRHAPESTQRVISGLQLPDRTDDTSRRSHHPAGLRPIAAPAAEPAGTDPAIPNATVRVLAGDTLWDIAAASLSPRADAGAIARRCAELHRVNREIIGADPGLIFPGQVLRLRPGTARGGQQ